MSLESRYRRRLIGFARAQTVSETLSAQPVLTTADKLRADRKAGLIRQLSNRALLLGAMLSLLSCGTMREFEAAPEHLDEETATQGEIPVPVTNGIAPPKPEPVAPLETYSVVVTDVPVRDLLFTLARDARINVDVHGDIAGRVTMNAIDQTLPQILARLAKQVDMRYSLDGDNLLIMPDLPYWQNYKVDYVNLDRGSDGEVTVATAIASTGGSVGEDEGGATESDGNISRTTVKSVSAAPFWVSLSNNLQSILAADSEDTAGLGEEAANPIVINQMAGVISAYATQLQHRQVQAYLDQVNSNVKRQVLIEVTIAEVELSDNYQAGVDWSRVSANGGTGNDGVSIMQTLTGNNLGAAPLIALGYNDIDPDGSGFSGAIKLLEQFGDTKVLSSPRIMALNNQTALLKVVDEHVYFTVESELIESTGPGIAPRNIITSEIKTVPVGFVMSVTPQINDDGYVSMNIRPTITRIIGFAVDPAPRLLPNSDFDNLVPEIHVSEIESLLEVADGQTVILGGLMQDEEINNSDNVPWISRLPYVGDLFKYRNDSVRKSELVIFLRPTVIRGGGTVQGQWANASLGMTHPWEADNLTTEDWDFEVKPSEVDQVQP